jgi:hypothetical protein
MAYRNKLKTAYGHIISCFHKPSQTVLQLLMSVNKLKSILTNPKSLYFNVVFQSLILWFFFLVRIYVDLMLNCDETLRENDFKKCEII